MSLSFKPVNPFKKFLIILLIVLYLATNYYLVSDCILIFNKPSDPWVAAGILLTFLTIWGNVEFIKWCCAEVYKYLKAEPAKPVENVQNSVSSVNSVENSVETQSKGNNNEVATQLSVS